ncbi:MAG: hypothetical protein K1X92_08310 [Bacteroidia bacterium]|nr:hypothetical protein [Bacteroidia bacterium]
MKKSMFFVAMLLGMFFLQSCQREKIGKEINLVTKTESAAIKLGETYSYTLPTDIGDDPFAIVTQTVNHQRSELTTNTNGESVYVYVPQAGFTGTDVVVISNEHNPDIIECSTGEHAGGGRPPLFGPRGPRHHDMDMKEDHTHYNITITIEVTGKGEVKIASVN